MKKNGLMNKKIIKGLFTLGMFLLLGFIVCGGVINSSSVHATGTWGLYYHSNGGHHTNLPDTQYCVPEEGADTCTYIIADIIPKRDGYDFMGWATDRSALEPEYQPGDSITTHACVKDLYAIWGLQLSFVLNGGEGDFKPVMCHPIAADVYLDEEELKPEDSVCEITFPANEPTREDYFFLGWGEEAISTEATFAPGDKLTLEESKTVFAIWAPIYKAVFNNNYKSGGINTLSCHSETTTYESCKIVIPETVPSRDGYEFLGWATIEDTTVVAFLPNDILVFGGAGRGEAMRSTKRVATETPIAERTLLLYAVWKEETPIPVPDTGIMTTDGDKTGMINNVGVYVAVPTALLVCVWFVKRATTKKVNFTKKKR